MNEVSEAIEHAHESATDRAIELLIERMACGDQRALEQFYESTVRRTYAVAVRILRQAQAAEEAVEDS